MDPTLNKLKSAKDIITKPKFLITIGVIILAIVVLTWVLQKYVAAPYGSTFLTRITQSSSSQAAVPNDLLAPTYGEDLVPDAPTLESLDKRLNRMEGMVTSATALEADVTTLKAAMDEAQSHIFTLETTLKAQEETATPQESGKSPGLSQKNLLAFKDHVEMEIVALNAKVTHLESMEAEHAQRSMLIMLIVQGFSQTRQLVYAGSNWYPILQGMNKKHKMMSEETQSILKDLLGKLSPFEFQTILPPAALLDAFKKAVGALDLASGAVSAATAPSGYLDKVKSSLGRVITIKHKHAAKVASQFPYIVQAEKALEHHQVAQALILLAKEPQLPGELKAWRAQAQMWVDILSLLDSSEEALLMSILQPAIQG